MRARYPKPFTAGNDGSRAMVFRDGGRDAGATAAMGVLLNSPQDEPALKSNEVEVEGVTGWLRAGAMGITPRLSSDCRTASHAQPARHGCKPQYAATPLDHL